MSDHTLAIIYIASVLFGLGCALGYPKDTRPWNAARILGACSSFVCLGAVIGLLVHAL